MIGRGFIILATLLSLRSAAACGTVDVLEASRRPSREFILRQALTCGLQAENLEFSVDEEGVDNAMIFPVGTRTAQYDTSVACMMDWAPETGAALGFEFEPRRS